MMLRVLETLPYVVFTTGGVMLTRQGHSDRRVVRVMDSVPFNILEPRNLEIP